MGYDIPEETQEELKILKKEMLFYERISPPNKKWVFFGIIFCLIAIIFSILNENFYQIAFDLLLGAIYFAIYFENKKTYQLNSAARDIINYYKSKESINKT